MTERYDHCHLDCTDDCGSCKGQHTLVDRLGVIRAEQRRHMGCGVVPGDQMELVRGAARLEAAVAGILALIETGDHADTCGQMLNEVYPCSCWKFDAACRLAGALGVTS
jgi:hypothetical protein